MAGIYIHIPFCKQACHYCNFHFSTQTEGIQPFVKALLKEIELTSVSMQNAEPISTIYFGGGTPSLLAEKDIDLILNCISKRFEMASAIEITLEANPDDVSNDILSAWLSSGINRLSLGVQSFVSKELAWMNRAHNAAQSLESIENILSAGFDNFSVDLIFGSPLLTDEDLVNNINRLTSYNIPHLSCYALTIEPNTALHHFVHKQKSAPTDSEKQARQFLLTMDLLHDAGYEQYEISNYAKPSKRSQHNSSYWEGAAYFGLGPSAHSFDGKNKRRWNVSNNQTYIKSLNENKIPFEEEILTTTQQANEYIMTALRKCEGISLSIFETRFGNERLNALKGAIGQHLKNGKLIEFNNNIMLTREGKLFADGIAADLFQD